MSPEFIDILILPFYSTLNSVFSAQTLKLHVSSLVIRLDRAKRLDEYENFEHDMVTYLAFIQYLQSTPEGPISLNYFDPKEFTDYFCDDYFGLRNKLIKMVTQLREIATHNKRAATAHYRSRQGTDSFPTHGTSSSVQGVKLLGFQKTIPTLLEKKMMMSNPGCQMLGYPLTAPSSQSH